MATRNGNLAYDISVYEPRQAKPDQQRQPRIQVKHNSYAKPQSASRIILGAAVVLAIMIAMLAGMVETNRLFGEMSDLSAELKTLEAENISLAAEYESRTSLKSVEDYAKNTLGLSKLEKSQIEYVEFGGNGVLEVVETERKNIFIIIRNWFSNMYEYIGA